jgi:hypothetical protein
MLICEPTRHGTKDERMTGMTAEKLFAAMRQVAELELRHIAHDLAATPFHRLSPRRQMVLGDRLVRMGVRALDAAMAIRTTS